MFFLLCTESSHQLGNGGIEGARNAGLFAGLQVLRPHAGTVKAANQTDPDWLRSISAHVVLNDVEVPSLGSVQELAFESLALPSGIEIAHMDDGALVPFEVHGVHAHGDLAVLIRDVEDAGPARGV